VLDRQSDRNQALEADLEAGYWSDSLLVIGQIIVLRGISGGVELPPTAQGTQKWVTRAEEWQNK